MKTKILVLLLAFVVSLSCTTDTDEQVNEINDVILNETHQKGGNAQYYKETYLVYYNTTDPAQIPIIRARVLAERWATNVNLHCVLSANDPQHPDLWEGMSLWERPLEDTHDEIEEDEDIYE